MAHEPRPSPPGTGGVIRLIGVYDADHTLRAEVAYRVGARLGRSHCPLYQTTHGMMREKSDWRACRSSLPVPFVTYHRDDQPPDVRAATGGRTPAVLADVGVGIVVLLDAPTIEACAGDPQRLVSAVEAAVARAGLTWPDRPGS